MYNKTVPGNHIKKKMACSSKKVIPLAIVIMKQHIENKQITTRNEN